MKDKLSAKNKFTGNLFYSVLCLAGIACVHEGLLLALQHGLGAHVQGLTSARVRVGIRVRDTITVKDTVRVRVRVRVPARATAWA